MGTGLPKQSDEQRSTQKRKRKVVYNACERCRATKVKCCGTMPCVRCVKENAECVFTGRAHQRAQRSLEASQHNLVTAREDLAVSQRHLEDARRENFASQHDLELSRSDLLMQQQLVNNQQLSIDNIFELLRSHRQYQGVDLSQIARESHDAADFLRRTQQLPDDVKRDLDLSRVFGAMSSDSLVSPPWTPTSNAFDATVYHPAVEALASLDPHMYGHFDSRLLNGQHEDWQRRFEDSPGSNIKPDMADGWEDAQDDSLSQSDPRSHMSSNLQ